jgi:uncharacterized protein DUF6894
MIRCFFDLVCDERSHYDYGGRDFCDLSKARQLAELMAIDLSIECEQNWAGWNISVRSAAGGQLFFVPVPEPCVTCGAG